MHGTWSFFDIFSYFFFKRPNKLYSDSKTLKFQHQCDYYVVIRKFTVKSRDRLIMLPSYKTTQLNNQRKIQYTFLLLLFDYFFPPKTRCFVKKFLFYYKLELCLIWFSHLSIHIYKIQCELLAY